MRLSLLFFLPAHRPLSLSLALSLPPIFKFINAFLIPFVQHFSFFSNFIINSRLHFDPIFIIFYWYSLFSPELYIYSDLKNKCYSNKSMYSVLVKPFSINISNLNWEIVTIVKCSLWFDNYYTIVFGFSWYFFFLKNYAWLRIVFGLNGKCDFSHVIFYSLFRISLERAISFFFFLEFLIQSVCFLANFNDSTHRRLASRLDPESDIIYSQAILLQQRDWKIYRGSQIYGAFQTQINFNVLRTIIDVTL